MPISVLAPDSAGAALHLRGGDTSRRALKPFTLRRSHKRIRKMPPTFGQGTEVIRCGGTFSLASSLTGAEDVTNLF